MYEAKPPQPAHSEALFPVGESGASLRALSWEELTARLSAERELRKALAAGKATCAASFDAGSARHLAHMAEEDRNDNHCAVNLHDSGNGKWAGGIKSSTQFEQRPATRGNT